LKNTEVNKHIEDEELVSRIVKNNDTDQFAVLYDRYSERVYQKCLSFAKSKSEAQDLTHDIFVLLFAKLRTFKGKSKFSTWLYSFTYNFCVNYVQRTRKKKNEKIVLTDNINEFQKEEIEVRDEDIFELKAEKLAKALMKIDPKDKMILLMKYQDEVSIKEIAETLEIGESAVKMRLNRAKSRLIEIYKGL